MQLRDLHTVYFVGIGGIGMSALARYFTGQGIAVHGYDRTATELTRSLESEGARIHYEEDVHQIPGTVDLVVYTPAVPATHKELVYFRKQRTPMRKRAEVLGLISRDRRAIAVAGTHGKTTTSSILTHLLRSAEVDCTAFLGGIAMNYSSNYVAGKSDWVVIEADEFDRSFLHLEPELAVITSMDPDHLDIYGDHEQMLDTGFRAFAKKLRPQGSLWVQHNFESLLNLASAKTYGIDGGSVRASGVHVADGHFVFDYEDEQGKLSALKFPLPGRHNVENAIAALAIARTLGAEESALRHGLESFRGIKRRFELIYRDEQTVYFDDYAHHPSELEAAIGAARELFPAREITGIFQPHLYSRTQDFAEGFAEALDKLDRVILLDIYPAREEPIPGVNADLIRSHMKNDQVRRGTKEQIPDLLGHEVPGVLLTLGAGDISDRVQPIKAFLESRKAVV